MGDLRLAGFHVEQFPVAERQFAYGKLPNHHFFSHEPVATTGKLAAEKFAGRKRAVTVPEDAIERLTAKRAAELFRKPSRLAPSHRFEREDVAKTVAKQQNTGLFTRTP